MGQDSKIEWTDHTFNPWRGCTKVSEGCRNCYAETLAGRNPGMLGVWGPRGSRVVASEAMWREPGKWDAEAKAAGVRRRVFCASLADVFEGWESMPPDSIAPVRMAMLRLFNLISDWKNLDWLLLTKRPENIVPMLKRAADVVGEGYPMTHRMLSRWLDGCPPENVWLGTSVENQAAADERIPHLLKCPAAVRFLSCEPLLGPVDLAIGNTQADAVKRRLRGESYARSFIHWVIVGGESGPSARPMHPDWARSIRDQCAAAGVPFFFKQWGEYGTTSENLMSGLPVFRQFESKQQWINKASWINGGITIDTRGKVLKNGADFDTASYPVAILHRVGKKAAGRLLDGREHNELPVIGGGR